MAPITADPATRADNGPSTEAKEIPAPSARGVSLLEHISRITEATTIEEVWALHVARMALYGFDRLLYGFTRFRRGNSFGSLDDVLVLSNHCPEYLAGFLDGGMYANAPTLNWATHNEGACSWRLVREMARAGSLTADEERVLAFNRRFDVTAGYTISFRDGSVRNKGAIGLVARPGLGQEEIDAVWEASGVEIQSINTVTHLKIVSLPYVVARRPLTARQREVLEWVGDGKAVQDIATILGVSAATVEKHLRLARDNLDVDTTAQAVLKAAMQNQIFVIGA